MRMKLFAINLIMLILLVPVGQTRAAEEGTNKTVKAVYLPLVEYYKAFGNLENETDHTNIIIDKIDNWQHVKKLIAAEKVDVVFIASPIVFEMFLKKQDFRKSKEQLAGVSEKHLVKSDSESNDNRSNDPSKQEAVNSKEQMSPELAKILESRLKIITKYVSDPIVINAVKKQNSKAVSLKEIAEIDKKWIKGSTSVFIKTVLNNNTSKYLRKKVKSNKLLYTEAFLCDNQGAIVGTYPRTSDYWQGDETKFSECFDNSSVFIGPLEFDESTDSNSVQVSIPVKDAGSTIGVLVFGLRNIKQQNN